MNRFREWLSDNLRYLLLIIGIFGVMMALFFGVRAVARNTSRSGNGGDSAVTLSADTDPESAAPAVSAAEIVLDPALAEDAVPEVTKLMSAYYNAKSAGDVDTARELVDTLPADEEAEFTAKTARYTDLRVYTKPGYTIGSYVVYSRYEKLADGDTIAYPELSQAYVQPDADGSLKIIFSDVDQATASYIEKVTAEDDVQTLIEEVRQQNSAAAAAAAVQIAAGNESAASSEESQTEDDGDRSEQETEGEVGDGDEASGDDGSGEESGNTSDGGNDEGNGEENSDGNNEENSSGEEDEDVRTVTANARVRSGPGTDYEVLGVVTEGTEVTVIDAEDGWIHVSTEYGEGYIGRRLIEGTEELTEDSDLEAETNEETTVSRGRILSGVNIRSGPGFDYSVIGTVSGGSEVTVLGYDGGWYHVVTDSAEGYVGQSYIEVW